jgi:hypothetical protein
VRAGLDELLDLAEAHGGIELFGFKANSFGVSSAGAECTVDGLLSEQAQTFGLQFRCSHAESF